MENRLLSGKYELQGEIGRGGMGVIYKATHIALNRPAAVKILHAQYAGDPSFLKRFQREARAMARLDHENIIRIYDVAQDRSDHYIVMEFFPGKDLKQLILEKGAFPPEEALSIVLKAAEALSYAHSHGVIHRDIKPGNIMVDPHGKVKIADFGIAAATGEASVTATDQIIGTPEYMSPEQARSAPLDGRSDLYSLGIVLYEMLNGTTPFEGLSRLSIIAKLVYEREELSLSFPPEIPLPLQNLVRTLLKRNPQDRIVDAKALIDRIKPLKDEIAEGTLVMEPTLDQAPIPPGKDPTKTFPEGVPPQKEKEPAETTDPDEKRKTLLIAGGIGGIILLLGVVFLLLRPSPPKEEIVPPKPTPPIEEKAPPPLPPKPPEEAAPLVPDALRQIEQEIQEIKAQLLESRVEADAADARRRAARLYQQAATWEKQGEKAFQEGASLVIQRRHEAALIPLQEAKAVLHRAREGYLKAAKAAEAPLTQREEVPSQPEKGAKQSQPPAEPSTQATEKPLPPPAPPPPRPDMEVVGEILSKFKSAYEGRDLAALQQISEMSESRARSLEALFRDHATLKVSIADFSLTGNSAKATVILTKLIDKNGNALPPPDRWKESK
ncbi:MAG: serine/threonine-protein kinase, partial [Candidatus Manganitrophaceae bacterium]